MMSTRPGQAFGVVLLVLQAILWGGGQILEARPAAEALTAVAHVEGSENPSCPPMHRHVDCVVCRAFGSGATGGEAPLVPVSDGEASCTGDADGIARTLTGAGSGIGARAPPAAAASLTPA
jgi:hypothetical protein